MNRDRSSLSIKKTPRGGNSPINQGTFIMEDETSKKLSDMGSYTAAKSASVRKVALSHIKNRFEKNF